VPREEGNEMKTALKIAVLSGAGLLAGLAAAPYVTAGQLTYKPGADQVRFQLLGNEPIAAPDGMSVVSGWSVLMLKDRRAGQCYLAFTRGDAMTAMPTDCPR
jgi:hypothetical protein